MTPNLDQILSIIRWALSVGGPLGALLISRGMPADQVTTLQASIIALVGALPPIASFIWGLFAHTDATKIASVTAMTGAKILVDPTKATSPSLIAAAADPTQPKVKTE